MNTNNVKIDIFPPALKVLAKVRLRRQVNGHKLELSGNRFHRSGAANLKIVAHSKSVGEIPARSTDIFLCLDRLLAHGHIDRFEGCGLPANYIVKLAQQGNQSRFRTVIELIELIRDGENDPYVFAALAHLIEFLTEVLEGPADL
jgi:hypothetical protein